MADAPFAEMPPTRSDYDISGWDDADDEFFLNVRVRDSRFRIHISQRNFHRSPVALEVLQANMSRITSGEDDDELWDYMDWIVVPFLPSFQRLAPAIHHVGKLTLAHLYTCQRYECELHVVDEIPSAGRVTPVESEGRHAYEGQPCNLEDSPFPTVVLSEVEVPYDDPSTVFDIIPGKVVVHNQTLFWKPSYDPELSRQEVDKYVKIARSGLPFDQLRTSRLYGVVLSARGNIRGLLYHWIDVADTLTFAVDETTPLGTREKYASQISQTVKALHKLDVVWGDVKSENVIIDKHGHAIVIDFEGGSTRGWVDAKIAGSMAGDAQGLEKLMDFIFNDASSLRPRDDGLPHSYGEDIGGTGQESM